MKKVFLLISLISSCFSLSAQTTFSYTGTVQTYTVPSGVTAIGIDAAGAQGGNSLASNGGNGGRVQASLTVTPGQVLSIYVGGQGAAGPSSSGTRAGGGNGGGGEGGNGNGYGGGGGGSSDIRTGGTALSNRIIVAAGGGGGGYNCGSANAEPGGNGGGLTGFVGFSCSSASTSSCGSGGTQTAGGTGATSYGASSGTLGAGANNSVIIYGGGGGGGYYGGGAGYYGGGGGGSSYYGGSGVSGPTTTAGFKTGNGYVIIYGPTVSSTPGFLNFGNVAVSSTAATQVFTLSASYMASSPITVNTTSSTVEFSFNGSTWFNTAQTYAYTLPGFSSVPLYVRFTPTASTEYYEYITISGGGLAETKNLLVVGNGVSTCSGTPDAGTATLAPYTGAGSTPFVLTLTGYSAAGGLTFQWQSSPTGTGSWTNISGATNATHSFTGISGTTYYQCNVTCTASTITSSSNVVMASAFPASSCSPTFGTTCPTYTMNASIASLIGLGGSAITNPSTTCAGSYYTDYSSTQHVTLYKGVTYPATINVSPPYYSSFRVQIWIDFDGDGAFSAGESIAGSNSFASASQVLSLPIPAGAPTGSFRMRIVGVYSSPSFPSIPPCPTASVSYGEVRDYKVTIQPLPPCITPPLQPTSLSLSPSLFTVSGSFTPAIVGADGYLTVVTTSSVAPTPPTDGVTYTVGANALGGKIAAVGSGSSFTATGLTDNTPYWFWVYSMNSACSGGPKYKSASPLNGTISTNACSFSGTKTVGPTGDYISIASALTAINSAGMNGNVALELQTTYTGESYPITISTLQCANSSRRLTIRPQGTMTVTASASSAMISLDGASYVTIDGRVGSTGTTKALTFTNTSTSSSATTIQLQNDASDNTVKHMTLRGANASSGGGVVMFRTTTGTTGSDNNTFDSTDIMEAVGYSLPINCFYATGTTGKENSGNTISNCNIANFYHSSTTSTGIYILTGNTEWTITGNRIYQSASRSYTSSQINRGIYINNSTSGNGFTISNNIIGYSSNTGSGTYTMTSSSSTSFYGITFSGSTTTPSSIQGNTITNINLSNTSGNLRGIDIVAGSVNIGTSAANIIGAATGNGAITRTVSSNGNIAVYGIYATPSSPAVLNIQNNTIGAITVNGTSTSVGAGIYGIFVSGTASTTISGNTIGSTSTSNSLLSATTTTSSGSQVIYGIFASISSSTPVQPVISDNTIANIRGNGAGSTSRMAGILFNSTSSGTISGNNINNLSNASAYTTLSTDISVAGIMYTGSTGTANITQNTINALSNTNNTTTQTHVAGILYSASVSGSITRNRIYDLRNASTNTSTTSPSTAIGIFCFSPTTSAVIANNMISLGNAQTTNTAFNGIMQGGTTSSAIIRVYYNSVLIMGTASSGSISSAALHRGNYSGSFNSTPFDIQNNIFENNRSGGSGKHYAIADAINGSSTSSGWPTNASNYNILNTTNAATVGYWSSDRTFASWKTASACDNNSFTASAATYTNASNGDLHINMGTTANNMESHGVVMSGYNTDYDNDTRPGPAGSVNGGGFGVDIGADEFDGVPLDNIPPVINYTNSSCGTTGNFTFTATVADPAGVPTTGGLIPRVYYRKGAGTWFSSAGTLTSGTGTNGVWTFTISATDMGGLVSGNIVSYYVIAQDNSAFVGSNPSPGLVATDVNTVTTPPTTPSTFTVGLSGTYSVGSGGDFNTITLAAAAYNGGCLTGPVTYNLITTTYPSETFPITFNGIATANATNTLTIKPASSTAVIIDGASTNGAIFKLLNARHITIDGLNAGGSSLTLNSTWTSTYANIWLASTSGTGPGCSNITLKNMTITGGSNATSGSYGILGGLDNGTFPTTSGGFNNDTITIQNNTITKCYYGIYASGTSSTSNGGGDAWVITGNTFGPASSSSTDNIGMRGVHFANMLNPTIVNNTFRNIGTSSITSQAAGIYLSSGVNGGSYSQNTIFGINNANSSSSTSANVGIYVGSTCINLTIAKNIIRDITTTSTSGGARGITINPSNSVANILIANNMISDIRCYATTSISQCPVGIGVDNTAGFVKVYYNTVHLNSSYAGNTTATGSACYFQNSSSAGTDLRNNNFINTYDNTNSGTDKGWAFYTTASNTAFAEIDHNNYFAGSPNIVGYTSGDRTTLTELQSAYGRNANSISTSPTFVSATDLRLQTVAGNTPLVAGTPVSVTDDIDGTSRNITNPVIGIHEVAFCTSITAGTVSAATSNFCVSGTTTVTATGATTGQSMQWKSSEDSTSWTTISGATNATYVIPTAITTTTFYRLVNSCTSSAVKDSATTKVTINPNPAAITGNLTACVSATTSLSNATSGGTWSSSNTAVGTVSSSGTVTALSAGTTEISYTITATGCYTSVVVTVNALPTVSAISSSSDNLCIGAAVTFTAGSVTGTGSLISYNWTGPNSYSTTTTGNTAGFTTTTTDQSGVYSLSVTYPGNGCTSSGVVTATTVTVNALPTIAGITPSTTNICNGTALTLTAGSVTGSGTLTSYNWSGPNSYSTTTSGTTATFTPTTTASSGVYSLSVTYPGTGCTSSAATSAAVTVNALPTVASITPSSVNLCVGTSLTLTAGSVSGAGTLSSYNWTGPNSYSTTTTGATATFTPTTTASSGVYTLTVTYPGNGCTSTASTSASVTVNSLPTVAAITASSSNLCIGAALNFTAGSVTGAGTLNSYNWTGPNGYSTTTAGNTTGFTTSTIAESGNYSVSVTYTGDGCTSSMAVTSPAVTVNALPTIASITPSTTNICIGSDLTFTAGSVSGTGTLTSYNWSGPNSYSATTTATTAVLSPTTTASSGVYTLSVTYPGTGCVSSSASSASVTVNDLPTVSSIVATPGTLCAESELTLTGSGATGAGSLVSYNWTGPNSYSSTTSGTVQTYTVPSAAASGAYSLSVTYTGTGCTSASVASAAVTVNALPIEYSITGGGSYCADGLGVAIGVSNSETGVNYQLYNGSTASGSPVAGTGSAITFGSQTATGTYTVRATNATTSCVNDMSGSTNITISVTPAYYTVTGGGSYCAGGSGVDIGLTSSDVSVSYQLYNGGSLAGSLVSGTGAALSFGLQTGAGTYTIVANPGSACARTMTGSAAVSILPVPNVYNVTGGGSLCAGATGVHIGLDWSISGVSYQLYNGATAVGSPLGGATSALDFGFINTAGTYTVLATNTSTSCTSNMTGSAAVIVNALPTAYSVTGGGTACEGAGGVALGLANSESGVNYQLYIGSSSTGSAVAGSGSAISFGSPSTSGTYTVYATNATTACANNMTGSATLTINSAPVAYSVTGGGNYCSGGAGLAIGLANSNTGIQYQLYNGATTIGSPVSGTGSAISFGTHTAAATYTVLATNTSTSCTAAMTSSATIGIQSLPTVYSATGGGNYCSGGTGVAVGLSNSNTGINYQLYNGASATGSPVAGTGSAISFGNQTTAGTYTVMAVNATTSCTSNMTGSAVVVVNALPTAQTVSGGGSYCSGGTGVAIGLNSSESGINYQLYLGSSTVGSPVTGSGSAISFGMHSTVGSYTVRATTISTSCINNMTGSVTVSINPLPGVVNVTGGGNYCSGGLGVHIGLDWSLTGINYQLYNGATAVGSPVNGSSSALDFGFITGAGVYTVVATNVATGCTNNMSGSATVVINALPTTYTVTGGGTACEGTGGVTVGLSNSTSGIIYQLYNGAATSGSALSGTGSAISFGSQTVTGVYTVFATNSSTACTNGMSGSATVTINAAPIAYSVTGGGNYCSGGSGVAVGLAGSNSGIRYQLYNGAAVVGSPVAGTGSAISFGSQTAAATFTVVATNTVTACTKNMTGSATVVINPLPAIHSVTGGGNYCAGGSGVTVGLSSSATGINYQLYNGASAAGSPVAGTGAAISFGSQTAAGTYTVVATNASTSCTSNMTGSAVVVINPLPTVQTVTGGGSYCTGGSGVNVGLNGSATGINYQLYNDASPTGSAVAGTGSAITFGLQTAAGTYTVRATNTTTSCVNDMTASATVVVNPLPTVFIVTGGGNYCAGGTGVAVGLNGSESGGISYQLYNGAAASGSPVIGTGAAISFGLITTAGAYFVVATNTVTACTSNMFGSTPIVVDPLPTPQNITGGGSYCAGGSGLPIGLDFSNTGINYQLYNGASAEGSPVAGTGVAISFGSQTASGTYSVLATNSITTCTNAMTGTATIVINPLPTVQTVTGGGTYCENFGGVAVGLSGSQTGIAYQLYNGASTMGSPVAGTGSAVSFGAQTLAGTYTVVATNTVTACTNSMSDSAIVIMNPAPTAHTVTGGGSYCAGSTGVTIGLSNSNTGITYQIYNGSSTAGSPVAGTGSAISFGTFTNAGTYTVLATNNVTSCTRPMTSNAIVIMNPLPLTYSMTGGGEYCAGASGVNVGLSSSEAGINYQLYRGGTAVGSPLSGTGAAISFGLQTVAGTYSILATNTTTSCIKAMTGTAVVVMNALPIVYNVTGGGNACLGGTGVNVGVDMSQTGVNYSLRLGTIVMGTLGGTASGINFGMMYTSGTYSVLATNATTGCSSAMSGSASVVLHNPPVAYTMTGGGSYCAGSSGVAIGLSNSATGVNYRLFVGTTAVGSGPTAGTGTAISFGTQTVAGTYTVLATSTTSGCTNAMTGSTTISINSLPGIHTVSGGGNYCPGAGGANISLSGSNTGITYQLFVGTTPIGTPVSGSGATLYLGTYTTVGTYSAVATNTTTGCTSDMAGSATIAAFSLPNVYVVTGGGNYCSGGAGVSVGLSGSETGVSYQLYNGSSIVGTYTGTGAALSFGILGTAGTYSVRATNTSTSCVNNMTGTATIIINDLPNNYLVTGGGNYCAGGSGFSVVLNGSNTGISYQLFNGTAAMGAAVAGTGSAINFGLQTVAGIYTVRATNTTTGCTRTMAGSPEIIVHPLPAVFNVTGGGSYCIGSLGVEISLDGSNTGIGYQLLSGSTTVGSMMSGSGSAVNFGLHTIPGTYTIMATNTGTGCSSNMAGSAFVVANPVPAIQTVTGGGGYCSGSAGSPVGINASATGTNYQLYRGTATVGSPLSGVDGALGFGLMTTPGVYTVRAVISSTGCSSNMTGTAVVSINPLPNAYSVSGGGVYCSGDAGANITLGSSDAGVTYKLYNGSLLTGTLSGTGSMLDFGPQTSGVYTVQATSSTTTCQNSMTGSASVIANPIPASYVVTGGGIHCIGSAGVTIGLAGSQTGVNYSLYNAATATGSVVSGTGSAVSFGLQAAIGNYTVLATNATTGCYNAMTGSVTVSVNPLPAVQSVTGGGSYCAGGAGVTVGLASSETGMLYQLYKNGTALSSYVGGTGGAITFGAQYDNGEYTVMAINIATTCTRLMSGSATVNTNPLPVVYNVTGGGAYCAGGSGVTINLSGSSSGISYQLYNGTMPIGSPITSSGSAINYNGLTAAGIYTILATNTATACSKAMSGTATVSINPLPSIENVTGGGAYCAGSAGVAIGLSSSTTGVAYTLYNGTTVAGSPIAGTGSALNFGVISGAGTYTVSAINSSTACAAAMAGSATISVNTLPAAFEVLGGGGYCAGGTGVSLALSGSQTGVNYLLYNSATGTSTTFAGTGDLIEFGMQTVAGTYTVSAVNATTSCTSNMTGEAAIVISPMPVAFGITGGGNYCTGTAGVTVGLNGSEFGVNYRLYKDGIATGTIVAGTGVAISFGTHAATGVYTAIAENTASTCSIAMTGSATIGVHPTPAVYTISAGGNYCTGTAGLMVSLNNSESGVNYRLYNGATLVGSFVAGTGSAISFGMQPAGLYSIMATNTSTSCTAAMSGIAAISVNALPVIYTVTGSGGYCSDAAGVAVGLSGSQNNVNYQLYNGATAVGSSVAGNGGTISFGSYPAGIYSVVGTSVITTCTSNMTGNANVFINAQPNTYSVSGGGDICAGAAGVTISLDGSQTGANYRLYNGTTAIGSIVAGTGTSLNFGMITTGGNYTVRAQNTGNTCSRMMTGNATIVVNPLPVAYNVSGGGSYCPGGTGVSIGLSGSEAGVDYQLYSGSSMAGASVAGTGSAIDFGMFTAEGSYIVVATNTTTSCGTNMSGSANVALNSQPAAYTLASSASGYCAGGAGVLFNLSGSQSGVTYRLYNGTTPASGVTTGTGSSINFGLKTLPGSYSVLATNVLNGCTTVMTGSPSITVNPLPGVFTVSGGGAYCAGGTGAPVTIIGSQTGINYQLYNGTTPAGSAVAGTGAGLTFGTTLPAGIYTVRATNPVSGCTSNMMGTASVIVNALPSAYNVTGGGQYCTGGSGLPIGLAGSSTGITYRLYNAAGIVGTPITGTGAALSFGIHTAAGSYSITATNPVSACVVNMTGTAVINASATLAAHSVTGGGAICSGATGVAVGLSGSANGVNYRLYNGTTPVGLAMAGTGSTLSFGTHTAAGTYTILATDVATSCTKAMSGNAVISINALPAVQTVTGGGNYCTGGSGVSIGLDGSAAGISYRLYHGTTPLATIAGGGTPLDFGMQTGTGAYTIKATNTTTGCISTMAGTAVIGITPSVVPSVSLTATTGDTVCAGTSVMFTTTAANGGTTPTYVWYVNGVEAAGTAATFSYTPAHSDVVSVAMSSSAACALPATTTAERTLTVRANQMPAVTAVVEGDTLCEGNPVTITATALYGGDNPSFTWVKNGITSAVGNVFTYTPANGDVISVRMTSNYSCRLATLIYGENDTLNIAVPYEPVVNIVANPGTTIAQGQILTLTAAATLTYMPTYQWHLNGNPIYGATLSSFTYNNYEDEDTVTVSVTNNTPCGALTVFNTVLINVNSVGVATVDQNIVDVHLMPNPANGTFTIRGTIGSKGNDPIEIEITDMLGQIVYRGNTELNNGSINKRIELSSALANGMYLVNLRTPAANKVFHLILQR